jgi:SAM-dependent methyltransferase
MDVSESGLARGHAKAGNASWQSTAYACTRAKIVSSTPASRPTGPAESARANRSWWDAEAAAYYAEHGAFLGDADLLWCPEGLRESEVKLLGDVRGRDVLEVGCGAAQGARWLVNQGAHVTAFDVSMGQLAQARRLDERTGIRVERLVQADAQALPFRDASYDVVVSAFGALPFVADSAGALREIARVLRPEGRLVFSVTHPVRWAFPDDPGPSGLTVQQSYFDRTPYVEVDDSGTATYVEHHRTMGDRIRELVAAGLAVVDVIEPEWPEGNTNVWGQWSPLRGAVMPGTALFVARKPQRPATLIG